jgi:hypothetical protein
MSLQTFSVFYFGHTITRNNNALDFSEGGPEIQATLNVGDYSLTEFVTEIKRAMDAVGGQVYTVSVNRTTRKITISATATFSLLAGTGTRIGTGVWSLIGYTSTDKTGTNTYLTQNGSGFEYLPQSLLEEHIASSNFVEKNQAVVNESASGIVQVIQFGTTRYVNLNIKYSNDYTSNYCQSSIETQVNGVLNIQTFMEYLITKAKFEFMPDRNNRTSFDKVLLDRTEKSKNGTAFTLQELKDAPGYFETGRMTLRVLT